MNGCAVYIVGGPGVGKSSLMAGLLEDWEPGEYVRFTEREMFGHYMEHELLGDGAYLGHLREEYPGTDALSRSVQPQALLWLVDKPELNWVFGEGERLGNIGFLTALSTEFRLLLVHLRAGADIMRQRREYRGGKVFTDQYIQAKTTQASNVARASREAGLHVLELDNTCTGVSELRDCVLGELVQR